MSIIAKSPRLTGFIAFAMLAFFVAIPVINAHPILDYDDFALLAPLQKIHSVSDYARAFSAHELMDIQPVRDLTYLGELAVGNDNYQFDNLLIWIATLGLFAFILAQLEVEPTTAALLVVVIGLHPVMHSSVYWIAGRKHLLSAFFVLLATLALLKDRRSTAWLCLSLLAFALSVFSQPISVGFPLVALVLLWNTRTAKTAVYLVASFAMAGWVAILNASYYASAAYANTGGALAPKFRDETVELLGKRFLVWGRDVFQIFLPFKPAIGPYNLESSASYIGLAVAVAILIGSIVYRRSMRWAWVLLAVLPISVVTVKLTSQGGLDSYLLIPLLASGLVVASQWPSFGLKRGAWVGAGVLIMIFCALDFRLAQAWSNKTLLWKTAAEWEGSKAARASYLQTLLSGKIEDATSLLSMSRELASDDPANIENGYLVGKSIYIQKISPLEKEKLFSENAIAAPWYSYFWSANDAQQGKFIEACDRLFKTWSADPRRFVLLMNYSIDDVKLKWSKMCELAKNSRSAEVPGLIDGELAKMRTEAH